MQQYSKRAGTSSRIIIPPPRRQFAIAGWGLARIDGVGFFYLQRGTWVYGWWAGEGCIGESADGWRRGVLILGESYGFKALHFENQEPQMNADERRFIVTGVE